MSKTKAIARVIGKIVFAAVVLAVGVILGWSARPAKERAATAAPTATSQAAKPAAAAQAKETYWTCSMHPQIHESKPGKCPVCGMDLIEVEAEPVPSETPAAAETKEAPAMAGAGETAAPAKREAAPEEESYWTCSMHPQIHESKPGRCPICGMDLIEVKTQTKAGAAAAAAATMSFSPEAAALMKVETAPVERRPVKATVRMVGKVDYDETRLGYISAWVSGRLDKLFVNFTGVTVNKGDPMVYLYSPELLSAQQELLQAVEAAKTLEGGSVALMRETAAATIDAARRKLALLGLTDEQVADIEKTGKPSDHLTIYAPMGGAVISKDALEGMYVETGTRIYTIADLSGVWVNLDAYESDLLWLRLGQSVEFEAVAYPGRTFIGEIAFIDPLLDEMTRTVKVRVNAANPDATLKPGMFVRARVSSRIDAAGQTPLVIPVSAALVTGKRAVVYVEVPGKDRPTYEGRVVDLGARAGDYYIVGSGLSEGERVVTRGNFLIDAAMQIHAKPSMMNPRGGAPAAAGHEHMGHSVENAGQPAQTGGESRHEH